jgi:hypothetical protein
MIKKTGWASLAALLDERPTLYLMTLCSVLLAMTQAVLILPYIDKSYSSSPKVLWVLLIIFFSLNCILGYVVDVFVFRQKAHVAWMVIFFGVLIVAFNNYVIFDWLLLLYFTLGGSILSSVSLVLWC